VGGSSRYFGAYRNLKGLKQDETLSIAPGDWAMQKVRVRCSTDCDVLAGSGGGHALQWNYELMPADEDEWMVHITPQVDPDIDFRMHFIVREKGVPLNDQSINPWTFISPSIRNTNGRVAASTFNRATQADYVAPDPFTAIEFGDGPVVLRTAVGNWRVELEPFATLGEGLGINAREIDATLTRADGTPVPLGRERWKGYYEIRPDPAAYRLVATDTYTVDGKPGKLTQTSLFDSRVYDAPPGLSALRIEDARGIATSTVGQNSAARLFLAARTTRIDPRASWVVTNTPVLTSGTKVWWRRHGTGEWMALPVALRGEEVAYSSSKPGPPGTMFTVQLDAATAALGEVDLKIVVENEYGATTEAVYEPAFVVAPADVRRQRVRR
jgi:hypothetical protein